MTIVIIAAAFIIVFVYFYRTANANNTPSDSVVSQHYMEVLENHVKYYQQLNPDKKNLFAKKVQVFLERVNIEGVGTEIEELDRILVASSAIIPIFGFGDWKYNNLTNVVLYPDTFNDEFQFEGGDRNVLGMVGTGYMNGQMILSKSALREGFSNAQGKSNTAIHEFVHLLDKSDGSTDGIPENLMEYSYTIPWLKMIHQEIHKIEKGTSDINPYAITNDAEFFAVVSEYFFKQPDLLESKHPEIYVVLSKIFQQDLTKEHP